MKFARKNGIDADPAKIDEVLSRSVANILPSREEFRKALLSGKRLRFYIGADATGPSLHIGHATNFMFLERVRRLGHEIIILFGDFTAMIGDPSGKESARKQLSRKEVNANIKSWKDQISKVVSFKGQNPATIRRNSKWLSKLRFEEIVKLSSHFTVQQMLERDMFEKRLAEEKPIYLHEFMYPLMQGYDSVAMDVDVEVGGNDQTFNMLAGRILQKAYNDKDKFVVATTLLVNPKTGKKLMNKSEGGYIALNDSATDIFGKAMALADEVIIPVLTDCTYLPMTEVNKEREFIASGGNPRDAKLRMAYALAELYHGKKEAERARDSFLSTFSSKKKEIPEDALKIEVSENVKLSEVILQTGLVESKTEWRRLVLEKAVRDLSTDKVVLSPDEKVERDMDLKIGKHRFLKIRVGK